MTSNEELVDKEKEEEEEEKDVSLTQTTFHSTEKNKSPLPCSEQEDEMRKNAQKKKNLKISTENTKMNLSFLLLAPGAALDYPGDEEEIELDLAGLKFIPARNFLIKGVN